MSAASLKISFVVAIALLPTAVHANPEYAPYPIIPRERVERLRCHMITVEGYGLDLTKLCDDIPDMPLNHPYPPRQGVSSSSSSGGGGNGGSGGSGGSSSGGNCPTASSTASDGSRCGGRASSERPGGR